MKFIKPSILILFVFNFSLTLLAQEDFSRLVIVANEKASSGDYYGALDDYNKIIIEYPNYSVVYYYRGNVKFRMNNFKEAILDYNRAVSLDSTKEEIYFYRGICKMELDDFKGALEDLNSVISLDPLFGDAYVKRGEVRIELNQKDLACMDFKKGLDLGEDKAKASIQMFCK